jgi:hypothetical protein
MQEAIVRMLSQHDCRTLDGAVRALREILQEVALLGLWRAKFFDAAAFYGGTALRLLYGLDRYSEDLDFSLLAPSSDFDLTRYLPALEEEVRGFGFDVSAERVLKAAVTPIQSGFLKANTRNELLTIEAPRDIVRILPRGQVLKVRIEIDTDPPPGFATETRYLLQPVPFPVRVYTLPDLFAGKMHAVLCRRWRNRVKGRDWYDFVWFAAHHPQLHLSHLEQRMRQTKHWTGEPPLAEGAFRTALDEAITRLDVEQARREVAPFVKRPEEIAPWSHDFFRDVARRVVVL